MSTKTLGCGCIQTTREVLLGDPAIGRHIGSGIYLTVDQFCRSCAEYHRKTSWKFAESLASGRIEVIS